METQGCRLVNKKLTELAKSIDVGKQPMWVEKVRRTARIRWQTERAMFLACGYVDALRDAMLLTDAEAKAKYKEIEKIAIDALRAEACRGNDHGNQGVEV